MLAVINTRQLAADNGQFEISNHIFFNPPPVLAGIFFGNAASAVRLYASQQKRCSKIVPGQDVARGPITGSSVAALERRCRNRIAALRVFLE
jgi:hypothetical protein